MSPSEDETAYVSSLVSPFEQDVNVQAGEVPTAVGLFETAVWPMFASRYWMNVPSANRISAGNVPATGHPVPNSTTNHPMSASWEEPPRSSRRFADVVRSKVTVANPGLSSDVVHDLPPR